jgi:hypothetical protein
MRSPIRQAEKIRSKSKGSIEQLSAHAFGNCNSLARWVASPLQGEGEGEGFSGATGAWGTKTPHLGPLPFRKGRGVTHSLISQNRQSNELS